ncbi:MAG: hypothetical protein ACOYVK_18110 [Bacillota bacterium]
MKIKVLALSLAVSASLFVGCAPKETPAPAPAEPPAAETTAPEAAADVVTTASVVTDEASLLNAVSKDGTWIVVLTEDFTTDKELVLEGVFTNKDQPARKLALYAQDADRNKTATYTLTAPKLVVKSENARIQGGTFVGDVYVEANGFSVVDAVVEGNVYFASEEFKSTFKTENEGKVTGVTEVK